MILCTVPCNLRDSPPFASLHRADLTGSDELKWQELYDKGVALEEAADHVKAIEAYRAASMVDNRYADLRFRLARCYLATGDRDEAKRHFVAARDLDALRFRADTRINQTIEQVAADGPDCVSLADAVGAMAGSDRVGDGIPGDEFFYEHIHLSFDGNYMVASTVFEILTELLPESIRAGLAAPPAVPSQRDCAERLAFSDWADRRIRRQMLRLTSGPPFVGQLDHDVAQAKRHRTIAGLNQRLASRRDARATAGALYVKAAADNPHDLDLARLLALFLFETADDSAVSKQWRKLVARIPNWARWQIELGSSLAREGKADEAVKWLERGLNTLPYDLKGHLNLGIALAQLGKTEQGIGCFRRMLALSPDHMPAHKALGLGLLRTGNAEEAAVHLRRAIELGPPDADVRVNLGVALLALERNDEAAEMFRRALELDPYHAGAQKGLEATRLRAQSP